MHISLADGGELASSWWGQRAHWRRQTQNSVLLEKIKAKRVLLEVHAVPDGGLGCL